MAEYELVREIPNLCRNNQMRYNNFLLFFHFQNFFGYNNRNYYQNKPNDFVYYNGFRNTLYLELENFLSSLGNDISIFGYRNIITIRKIKAFMYVIPSQDKLTIYLNNKEHVIKNYNDLYKMEDKIEKAYDEN